VALVASVVPDLMLASRVAASLGAAGHEVVQVSANPPVGLPAGAELVVCDLEAVDPVEIAALPVPALGFYSHVDVETRNAARSAGVDLVIPRSRMARELPGLADRLLRGSPGADGI
jgi:hypothetical protein